MFERKPPLCTVARCDGHELVLQVAYHPNLIPLLKRSGGSYIASKEHPCAKAWRFPIETGRMLPGQVAYWTQACGGQFHETPATLESKLLDAERAADPRLLQFRVSITLYAYVRKTATVVDQADNADVQEDVAETGVIAMASYHRGFNAFCQRAGGRWNKALKGWVIPRAEPALIAHNLAEEQGWASDQIRIMDATYSLQGLTSRERITTGINWKNASPERVPGGDTGEDKAGALLPELAPRTAGVVTRAEIESRLDRYGLDDYQRVGVHHLLAHSSSLLADDMGLGKTRQAIAAADIGRQGGAVLVVCPASLIRNWAREISQVIPGARIALQKYDPSASWTVTNYERVRAILPHASRFEVVIYDEAHVIKNPAAEKTRTSFDLAGQVRCRMVLTGTPLLNSISEIHTLLRLSGHPLGMPSFKDFSQHWSAGDRLKQLNQELKGWMLRREKESVLDLPGKHRRFVDFMLTQSQEQEHAALLRDATLEAYVKLTRLRQMMERWKLPFLDELWRQLGVHDKLIVFVEYKPSVERVLDWARRRGIGAVGIDGDVSPRGRDEAAQSFQTDPDCRVFVGTTAVAGVGLTLTAANHVAVLGMPWTWGILEQAEDRAYRRGQRRPVHVTIPMIRGGVDEHIFSILSEKKDTSETVVKGRVHEMLSLPKAA